MFEPIGISVQRFASPGNRRRIMALTSSLALIEWAAVARSHGTASRAPSDPSSSVWNVTTTDGPPRANRARSGIRVIRDRPR